MRGVKLMRIGAAWSALVAGLVFAAGVSAELNCNVGVEFHDGGPLRSCVLNGDHHLYTASGEALTCADGTRASLHRDGKLASCTLARPARLEGQDCPAGAQVEFAGDGRLLHCKKNPSG
jgi:hypothetical protein